MQNHQKICFRVRQDVPLLLQYCLLLANMHHVTHVASRTKQISPGLSTPASPSRYAMKPTILRNIKASKSRHVDLESSIRLLVVSRVSFSLGVVLPQAFSAANLEETPSLTREDRCGLPRVSF